LQAERNQVQEANKHAEEVALLHTRGVEALASAMTANAKLDAAIEATSLAVLMLDRRGNVISWNSLAERIFGWSSEEALGRPVPFAEGLSQEMIQRMIAETLRGESVSGTELKQWRRDGSPFDAVVWTAPLHDPEGGISGILITVADVSDRKRLEDQLRLSQKMEAVGRLAGGVAHDFNNLLTVINGYSAMLVDSLKGNPHAVGQAAEILSAGTRAGELVSQLLAFSRRQMIKAKPIDINQLVQSVERMLRRIIGEHIEFRTELDPAAGWIRADPNQMEAVLLNLVTNAQDAMANGGVLSIGTAPVEVTPDRWSQHPELPVGSYVRLAVRDTGHGMDSETQQHVFEPFFTTKETGKGTGLGLSSVYGAIEQSGGRIIVDSKVGNGTTFSIYLPRCEAANSIELTQNLLSHSDPGSETILLVEDESAVRDMLREVLSKAGYKVWVSADGAEALGQWGSRIDEIDLVVSDIVMPVMNGLRLAEELRNRRPEIRVIFMSGHSLELINTQSLPDPAPDLLQKPFAPEALVRKVREILDHAPKPRRASNRSYSAATRPGS
jgi:PAS domain S-box-containing protein